MVSIGSHAMPSCEPFYVRHTEIVPGICVVVRTSFGVNGTNLPIAGERRIRGAMRGRRADHQGCGGAEGVGSLRCLRASEA